MNRELIHRHLSTASIFLFALLLMAAVACAGGSDDGGTTADEGGTEVVTPTEGGNGNGNGGTPTDGGGDTPPDTSCNGAMVKTVDVAVTWQGQSGKCTVTASPETVTITTKGRVCWDISGLEDGYTLTMSGKSGSDNQFPDRTAPPSPINSGAPNGTGTFQYDLTVTKDEDGSEACMLDPQVIINPDPGS